MAEEKENGGRKIPSWATRLPFGLCKRYGIVLPKDATPRRAWDVLRHRGISRQEIYEKISGKENVSGKNTSKETNNEKIETLISKYGLRIENNKVVSNRTDYERAKKDGMIDEIKNSREKIIKYIKDKARKQKEAKEERAQKIAAIPGLEEIRQRIAEEEKYERNFARQIYSGQSVFNFGKKPESSSVLRKQYPVADAFLKAEAKSYSSNYDYSAAGAKALERIINEPQNYQKALDDMEKEISEATRRHFENWD